MVSILTEENLSPSAHPGRECRVILSYGKLEASLGYVKLGLKNTVSEQNPNNLHRKLQMKRKAPN